MSIKLNPFTLRPTKSFLIEQLTISYQKMANVADALGAEIMGQQHYRDGLELSDNPFIGMDDLGNPDGLELVKLAWDGGWAKGQEKSELEAYRSEWWTSHGF